MSEEARRLVKHGFIKSDYKHLYKGKTPEEIEKMLKDMPLEEIEDHADEEEMEMTKDQYVKTGYPTPIWRYRIEYESYRRSIEEIYYWLLNYLRQDIGYAKVDKIMDVFAAAEHSAFFGVAQQRLGMQQDKVSQLLATIGKMVRELFQLVRELRILDERLSYYEDSMNKESKSRESAEITLKGIYIDMVEGGAKSPSSVYGMARELQFTTLPDLFYSVHPSKPEEVDEIVDKLEFNRKVKEVLKRKLRSFLEWKEHTYKELKTRRIFTLKYLRQHYDIIKMYMTWVKPYLRNIRRLQNEAKELEKPTTPDLISAFEGSIVEIEILARKIPQGNKNVYACILLHFFYRTRPSLSYQQEGYQRGPIHIGSTRITYRAYAWTKEQIEAYKKMRDEEDFELLSLVDNSVKAAMEALGDELEKYLKEAGESFEKKENTQDSTVKREGIFTPFTYVFKNPNAVKKPKPKKPDPYQMKKEIKAAIKEAKGSMWLSYKNFKKAHKMLSW